MWYCPPPTPDDLTLILQPKHFCPQLLTKCKCSIGLPPKGQFHIDVDPNRLAFGNQSIKGTLVSPLGDIDETLNFARRGTYLHLI